MKRQDKTRDDSFKRQKLEKTRSRRKRLHSQRDVADYAAAARNDLLPALCVTMVACDQLVASPHRTRRTTPEQLERITRSIADLTFTDPIIVRGTEIVDGAVRVEAAGKLGLQHVPAIDVSHLSDLEVRKLRLALNRTAELGQWDLDQLRIEFEELLELDVDLGVTGFADEDLDIVLLADAHDEGEIGAEELVPDRPAHPVSEAGDLWKLDKHRLFCGNSLEPDSYTAVMGGELAHAVLTDSPWNVPIAGHVSGLGKITHSEFAMATGEMSDTQWQAFLDEVLVRLAENMLPGAVAFCFIDWRSIHRIYQAGVAAGLEVINLCVWHKPGGGAMGSLYRSAHELVPVFCKGSTPRVNRVQLGKNGRNRSNVWSAPGANTKGSSANAMLASHPTPKNCEMCADAILDVTERSEIVLDAFAGSGTTLIAAEKTGRECRAIEIDGGFCDLIVRRWEKLTGKQAQLAATGEAFNAVALRRAQDAAHGIEEGGNG